MFSFCKPLTSKKRYLPFRQLDEQFSFTIFESADDIHTAEWIEIIGEQAIFLQPDYLKLVETSTHTKITARYVILYFKGKACAAIYFQVLDFKAGTFGEILGGQMENASTKRLKIFENYLDQNKNEVLLRLFTCGNNLVSGAYGFVFDKSLSEEKANTLLLNIIELVSKEEKLKGVLSAILIKDFKAPLSPESLFEEEKYTRFFVEPNLIVEIPAGVKSLDDYTALFSKKYRNRAKSIFKSFEGIESRFFDLDEIIQHEKVLYRLYEEIFAHAKFKLIKLTEDYFSKVKALFKERFKVIVFLLDQEIVAFASIFLMPDHSVEAHYIGFSYALNHRYNLYQNLLYKIINEAIVNQRSTVNLGRTAAEIKTTVGAKAEDLNCYIKPQNAISRIIQKPFIGLLQPAAWIPRNPFKEELEAVKR